MPLSHEVAAVLILHWDSTPPGIYRRQLEESWPNEGVKFFYEVIEEKFTQFQVKTYWQYVHEIECLHKDS